MVKMTVVEAAGIAERPAGVLDEDVIAASVVGRRHLSIAVKRSAVPRMAFYAGVVSRLAAELEQRVT